MPVTFPAWARLALGAVIAVVGYLVAGDAIRIDEGMRALLSSLTLVLASAGIVPPKPEDIHFSPTVSLVLSIVVVVGAYLLNVVPDIEPLWRGLIVAGLAFLASIGIVPPQVRR